MSSTMADSKALAVNAEESGWTTQTLKLYYDALRLGDEKLRAADERFLAERDRRYAEVNTEREKALKIKEEADKAALFLAREIQTYKDEKANELREQISRERGLYVSKPEVEAALRELSATIKPLADYVASQQGRSGQMLETRGQLQFTIGQLLAIGMFVIGLVFAVWRNR